MGMQSGEGTGGKLVTVVKDIASATAGVVGWFRQHETVSIALAAAIGTVLLAFAGSRCSPPSRPPSSPYVPAMLAPQRCVPGQPGSTDRRGHRRFGRGPRDRRIARATTFRKIVDALWDAVKAVADG